MFATSSIDTGVLTHSSHPNLLDFPHDATFHIWRKPHTGVEPIDGGSLHIGELIQGDGDHLLVCFATMATDDWEAIKYNLSVGDNLDLKPLLVASVDKTNIASGLWGAGMLAGLHSLTKEPSRGTVFVPSAKLMKILGIGRGTRTRNALVLIRDGHICAEWISGGGDGDKLHDWTTVLSMVD